MAFSKTKRRQRIKKGIRRKISGTAELPRISVFRSNKAIYAQLIDDAQGVTLAAASTNDKALRGDISNGGNTEAAAKVGAAIAAKAKDAGVEQVVFDRGPYLYHGRLKALAEAAREGGLQF